MKKTILVYLLAFLSFCLVAQERLTLKLERQLVLGKQDVLFQSIASIYEDKNENIYVLDFKACKVHKFSPGGELIRSFGNKGRGPGDFSRPHTLYVNSGDQLVVNEVSGLSSLFDANGTFLKHVKAAKGFNLNLLGDDLFYGWLWTEKGKQQVVLNGDGKIVRTFFSMPRDKFAVNLPDETGRSVVFRFFAKECSPYFLFYHYNEFSAVAFSGTYKILLLKNDGTVVRSIARDIPLPALEPEERKHLAKEISENNKFPAHVNRMLQKKLPAHKNFFSHLLLSPGYVWGFRIKDDITRENAPIMVDLFDLDGTFRGKLSVKRIPYHISKGFIYFYETGPEEDDVLLVKYKYQVVSSGNNK